MSFYGTMTCGVNEPITKKHFFGAGSFNLSHVSVECKHLFASANVGIAACLLSLALGRGDPGSRYIQLPCDQRPALEITACFVQKTSVGMEGQLAACVCSQTDTSKTAYPRAGVCCVRGASAAKRTNHASRRLHFLRHSTVGFPAVSRKTKPSKDL